MSQSLKFPNKFFWGTATAAFQIEGHPEEYLGKLSDWSEWIDRPDKVLAPSNQGRAVDHYQHLHEDINLIKDLGSNSYRFSFNWARLHRGPGEFDDNTLQFYKSLIEQLKANKIEPFATIIHFVLPNWLAKEGGWTNPQTAYEFGEFAKYLAKNFASQIKFWITHNEPNIFLNFGYESGIWPPGLENDWNAYFKAYQGLLLGHQMAYIAIKEINPNSQIGFAQNLYSFESYESITSPKLKSWQETSASPNLIRRQLHNYAFIESCLDLNALDFLGVNYYTRFSYKLNPFAKDAANPNLDSCFWGELQDLAKQFPENIKSNSLNWEIYPEGLFKVLSDKKLKGLLGERPVYITENGYCHVESEPGSYAIQNPSDDFDKDFDDQYRIRFIKEHLIAVHKAIYQAQVNVQGYFYWSLLDNFEWALGMKPRFGLVHVDHSSFVRKPKASYYYYQKIAQTNSLPLFYNSKDSHSSHSCSSQNQD